MNQTQENLWSILRQALGTSPRKTLELGPEEWNKLFELSSMQGLTSVLYDVVAEQNNVPEIIASRWEKDTQAVVRRNYRLLFFAKFVVKLLEENQVPVLLLKGMGLAALYPVPEQRKSSDIDLLLENQGDFEKASTVLRQAGIVISPEQHANHHMVFYWPKEQIYVELHTRMAEFFDNKKINRYLEEMHRNCHQQRCYADCMGLSFPVLKPGFETFQILIHMLQHFLRAGFGLRLLCDWVLLWQNNMPQEEQTLFWKMARETGLEGFACMIMKTCAEYLGLSEQTLPQGMDLEKQSTKEFVEDILTAGEFGEAQGERMVALRGNKVWDYAREFHHQMHINFPKAGKVFLCWPVLWVVTLVRFLSNNKRLNRASSFAIFQKAEQRSHLISQMNLFRKQ